jgi:hypothetical protein
MLVCDDEGDDSCGWPLAVDAATREAAMTYSQIAWLPLSGGLTLLGLIGSWFAWKRRGIGAGLRGVAWSLLPLAAYLIGAIQLLWRFGTAITSFAASFVFSPRVWAGVIVTGLALVLFVVSGRMRRGRAAVRSGPAPKEQALATRQSPAAGSLGGGKDRRARAPAGKNAADGDDFSDIEQILRRRGIR